MTENPWIEWNGGECPVERGTMVQTRHRDGYEFQPHLAEAATWQHAPNPWPCRSDPTCDIIAYRVVQP